MPDYPANWDELRHAAYERAHWKCEHCGMEFEEGTTAAIHHRNADGSPVRLTVHHLDGDTANNDWRNLLACCQICHLHIQGRWKPGWPSPWRPVPAWLLFRELPYYVQLALFGD